jgi:predicted nucleotidyltransferase
MAAVFSMKVEFEKIKDFCDKIAEAYNPQKIILFGSHARGDAGEDSDVDILVIMDFEGRWVHRAVEMRSRFQRGFPLDLLVRTPEWINERLEMDDWFVQDILKEGRVLYEAAN